jgi:hypothetical protein
VRSSVATSGPCPLPAASCRGMEVAKADVRRLAGVGRCAGGAGLLGAGDGGGLRPPDVSPTAGDPRRSLGPVSLPWPEDRLLWRSGGGLGGGCGKVRAPLWRIVPASTSPEQFWKGLGRTSELLGVRLPQVGTS